MTQTQYKIIRFYFADSKPNKIIKRGLTLDQAQAHCRDPETSSITAKTKTAVKHTQQHGHWFDGYDEDK